MKTQNVTYVSAHIQRDIGVSDYQAKPFKATSSKIQSAIKSAKGVFDRIARGLASALQPRMAI